MKNLLLLTITLLSVKAFAQTTPPPCIVAKYEDLVSCRTKLNSGATTTLLFTSMIDCTDKNCKIEVFYKSNITIAGWGQNVGIKRRNGYDKALLNISNSTNINVANLKFDDGLLDTDFVTQMPKSCGANCQSQVIVYNTSDVKFSNMKLLGGKVSAITFVKSKNIVFKNSEVTQVAQIGLLFDSLNSSNSNITIKNNYFHDNRSNAILVTGKKIRIRENIFQHNHLGSAYHSCGPNQNEPCNGGQVLLMSLDDAIFENNFIMNSRLDETPNSMFVMDIEIGLDWRYNHQASVTNLLIQNNDIYFDNYNANRFFWSITMNGDPLHTYSNVVITNNRFHKFPKASPGDLMWLRPGGVQYGNSILVQ